MSRIVLTTPQITAVAEIVAKANEANANGYSIEYTDAVLITSSIAGATVAQVTADGSNIETWNVRADGHAARI